MKTLIKLMAIPTLAALILLAFPAVARAEGGCSGIACWFSWDLKAVERKQIAEDAETERARIEAAAETERQRLENDRLNEESRIANQHTATLERINRDADAAIAQAKTNATIAEAEKDKYIAFVENWRQSQVELARFETDKALATIRGQTDAALKALEGQTDLGLKALMEAGETKRWALTTDLIWSVVLIVGLVFLGWYFLNRQGQPQVIQVLPPPPNYHQLHEGYRAQLPGRSRHAEQEIVHYHDQ